VWQSDISDDHTPVEFSIACDPGTAPTLRILGEALAPRPGRVANLDAALRLLDSLTGRFDVSRTQFDRVRDVFLDQEPLGLFSMWFSTVHRPAAAPEVKIYFDPNAQGTHKAPQLVAEGLRRLRFDGAYETLLAHGVRPGELGRADRFAFFAVDLHARSHARVKVYLSHHNAGTAEVVRAAGAVEGIDDIPIREFLEITDCRGPLTRRPLVSSYTFLDGDTDRPSGYSLYLPIRDYVDNDEQARERMLAVLTRYGLDAAVVDRAVDSITDRRLCDGVGLIAHLSLRLARDRPPGVTVYLSSEAYQVTPPRSHGSESVAPTARSGDEEGRERVAARSGSERWH
jgi:hypothetical protein